MRTAPSTRLTVVILMALTIAACGGSCSNQPAAPAAGAAVPAAAPTPAPAPKPVEAAKAIPAPSPAQLHGALRPTDEQLRDLYDISRDVGAIAAREKGAVDDLAQDLSTVTREDPPPLNAGSLARAVDRAMAGCRTDDQLLSRIAVGLYVAVSREVARGADREALGEEVRTLLSTAGCNAAGVSAMAQAVRQNPSAKN